MNEEQKQRAAQMLRRFSQANPRTLSADTAAVDMAALLQELIDAEDRWKSKVKEAIGHAEPNERSVMVDGLAVFFSRADDSITDTHTPEPCPHCGGSGAAEDCKQAAGVPDGWKLVPVEPTNGMRGAGHRAAWRSMWKLVPVEPTNGMRDAGHRAAWRSIPSLFDEDDAANVYRAMLAAAPERDQELARDAERYRWLRTYNTAKHPAVTEAFFLGDENLDAEIDAAIAAEKGATQ